MKWYLQVDQDNIICDAIEHPVEGYTEVELPDTQLPAGINGGWYKWENGTYVEYPELKPETELEQRITELEMALAAILGGAI